jgi:hypothetical protein
MMSAEEICDAFRIPSDSLEGCTLHVAVYSLDYDGCALVVYEKGGTLYEVNGSHCSCYDLEGQWEPEATNPDSLRLRTFYESELQDALNEYLASVTELPTAS